ncbi:unnamed protein product [Caenorhabditis angaria]|uniref:Zinc-hook domain-containing protein n=1 Tax=Caenorhabditis angaria TaxID=860376 RepID=A0A9P1N5Z7_9PELO|nr:unnamed protein product [Caenorhabditis angaria]
MAQFLRLKIRGIRSVGDDERNAHFIEFLSPCTLINGPNGTGKTTTIEALNYITTGALPSGKMNAFIHSIAMAKKSRVDASVTLEFLDVKKRLCTATRRMTCSLKGGKEKKMKCQSEEFNLVIKYPDGTTSSISSKVADFERAILHHLGVPKSIFNLVIFCHQEDSTWPLSEPKELKLKFDQIFQLTKFVKAQDQMKKLKKEYDSELKMLVEREMRCLDQLKIKIENTKIRDKCLKKKEERGSQLEEIKEKKTELMGEKADIEKRLGHVEKCLRDAERKEIELRNLAEQIKILRVEPYSGTEQQLRDEIRELDNENSSFESEKHSIAIKLREVSREIESYSKIKRELENEIANLNAYVIHRENIVRELGELEESLKFELDVETENQDEFLNALDDRIREKRDKIEESARIGVDEIDEIQRNVDEAQKNVTKNEVELKNCEKDGAKIEDEIEAIERKLKSIDGSSTKIEKLTLQKDKIEAQLQSLPEFDENSLSDLIHRRNETQKELDILQKKCKEAEQFAEAEKEIRKKSEELQNSKDKLEKFSRKHEKNWDVLYGEAKKPEAPWSSIVKETSKEIRKGLVNVEEQLKNNQLAANRCSTIIQQAKNEEEKISFKVELLEEQISESCGCSPEEVSEKLKDVRTKLKLLRKELAPIDAKIVLYDSWIEESNTKSCCPLCDRKFTTKSATTSFSQKLQDVSFNFPNDKEDLEKKVIFAEEEEQKYSIAETNANELSKLKSELAEKRRILKKFEEELKEHENSVEETKEGQHECNNNLKCIMEIQNDVGMMDSIYAQIQKLTGEIQTLQKSFSSSEHSESYLELKEKCAEKEELYREIVRKGDTLQNSANRRNNLEAELNKIREERVSLEIRELSTKKAELKECEEKYDRLKRELPSIKRQYENVCMERNQRNDERRQAEAVHLRTINELKTKKAKFVELAEKADRTTQSSIQLEERKNEFMRVSNDLEIQQKRKMTLELDINNLNGNNTRRRTLEDQMSRMNVEKKASQLEQEIETLKKLGADRKNAEQMREKLRNISSEFQTICQNEIRLTAYLEENEVTLKQANGKLAVSDVRNAPDNYRNVVLDVALVKETVQDLTKYMQCLDKSLIKFHAEKMSAVNEIVDELWRKVYNSTDIETIRIRSNSAETSSSSSKTRAYDYMVVMVTEGGLETEMRGRCSAGQKMLASLIIRLALAEVFGGLCSMIALDEPTTNLDDSKVEGMAEVLNELIVCREGFDENGRRRGRQMQMVVITHDERLVNLLTLGCRPEYIYCLGKNENGLSNLKKRYPDGREVFVTKK